ncbi:MAG TPA: GGDEF domain-containing protein [Acidimicrobiales bacterium]|nr:GGDEF domain-containing protein [Acidimicrobiales bacterium]
MEGSDDAVLSLGRGGELRAVQRRFALRWRIGVAVGFAILGVNWVGHDLVLDAAARELGAEPAALDAIARLRQANEVLSLVAGAVLVAVGLVFFRPLDRTLRRESRWIDQTEEAQRRDGNRRRFAGELHEAMEMAGTEAAIAKVAEAVFEVVGDRPAEMLLADASDAHMRARAVHPEAGGAGCGVGAPFECPAVKRARAQSFPSSRAINACPHLRERDGDPRSAYCAPVAFMGRSLGVVHLTGPEGEPLGAVASERVDELAGQLGMRIGTVRALARAQLQASTDSLTGLANRRTAEEQLGQRLADGEDLAVALVDLDHFKRLNDTYGHDAGDRALRLFADTVRRALRTDDLVARWGGEEFIVALPGLDRAAAADALDRIRLALVDACARAEAPTFTASFGVVDTDLDRRLDVVVREADAALSRAKEMGRDRVVVGPVDAAWAPVATVDV